jgi:hypothetical protein
MKTKRKWNGLQTILIRKQNEIKTIFKRFWNKNETSWVTDGLTKRYKNRTKRNEQNERNERSENSSFRLAFGHVISYRDGAINNPEAKALVQGML